MYTFGSNYYGCLGCDNEAGDEVLEPIPVNFFSNHPVTEISCGENHTVALTKGGDVFTWGCGEFGKKSEQLSVWVKDFWEGLYLDVVCYKSQGLPR